MNTAMMKLRNEVTEARDYLNGLADEYNAGQVAAYNVVIEGIDDLLEEEKKQIKMAYERSSYPPPADRTLEKAAEGYYNKTYSNNKRS